MMVLKSGIDVSLMLMETIEPMDAAWPNERPWPLDAESPSREWSDRSAVIRRSLAMMTPASVLSYVKAEPFRPFRIHMASGGDVRRSASRDDQGLKLRHRLQIRWRCRIFR